MTVPCTQGGGAYRPRTFNFYTFPRPFEGADKRFVCQASGRQEWAGDAALWGMLLRC